MKSLYQMFGDNDTMSSIQQCGQSFGINDILCKKMSLPYLIMKNKQKKGGYVEDQAQFLYLYFIDNSSYN